MPTEPTPRAATQTPKPAPAPAKKAPAKKATPRKATPAGGGKTFTVDSFMAALRTQESGGNYTAHSGTSSASGAYQYIDSTWNNYGGYAHAWQAPRSVQDARARADIQASLARYNGDWEKVAAAHFAGAGWVAAHPDKSTWNQNPVPGSQNPTVMHYVTSVFSHAGQSSSLSNTQGGTGQGLTPTATSLQIKDEVARDYGYMAAFMDDPELGPILTKAAQQGWDQSTLQGAIYKTHWYQSHSAATREFDSQTRLDPATQKANIASQVADITAQAKRAGVTLDAQAISQMAVNSLRFGWNAQQLTNAIIAQGKLDLSGKNPNAALTTKDNLVEAARQYMVPVSDQQLTKWVKDIQAGNLSVNDFNGYLKEQAKSLFPGLSGAIDRGVTVEQYADPYRQQAANILEVDPESIDFMKNPTYQKALFQVDPKTGDRTAMSLADWSTYLRGLPQYAKTNQAKDQAAQFAQSILSTFGKVSF